MQGRPPPYGMSESGRPAPYHYNGDYYHDEKRRGGNIFVKIICCCYCFMFFLILVLAAIALWMFTYYDLKEPTYKFESLEVKEFGYKPDFNINANLILTLKADNPNKKISFFYGDDNYINVTFSDKTICSGKIPAFQHGLKNTTILQIELKGKNQFASGIFQAFQDNEKKGKIPLKVVSRVPVIFGLGDHKLDKPFIFIASVDLTVHDLKTGKKPEFEQGKFNFKMGK